MTVINLDEMDKKARQAKLDKFCHRTQIACDDLVVSIEIGFDYVHFEIGSEVAAVSKEVLPDFLAAIQALVEEE